MSIFQESFDKLRKATNDRQSIIKWIRDNTHVNESTTVDGVTTGYSAYFGYDLCFFMVYSGKECCYGPCMMKCIRMDRFIGNFLYKNNSNTTDMWLKLYDDMKRCIDKFKMLCTIPRSIYYEYHGLVPSISWSRRYGYELNEDTPKVMKKMLSIISLASGNYKNEVIVKIFGVPLLKDVVRVFTEDPVQMTQKGIDGLATQYENYWNWVKEYEDLIEKYGSVGEYERIEEERRDEERKRKEAEDLDTFNKDYPRYMDLLDSLDNLSFHEIYSNYDTMNSLCAQVVNSNNVERLGLERPPHIYEHRRVQLIADIIRCVCDENDISEAIHYSCWPTGGDGLELTKEEEEEGIEFSTSHDEKILEDMERILEDAEEYYRNQVEEEEEE